MSFAGRWAELEPAQMSTTLLERAGAGRRSVFTHSILVLRLRATSLKTRSISRDWKSQRAIRTGAAGVAKRRNINMPNPTEMIRTNKSDQGKAPRMGRRFLIDMAADRNVRINRR